MKPEMRFAQSNLTRLLEAHEQTAGLYVRVHGENLIVGRREPLGPVRSLRTRTGEGGRGRPDGEMENDDRVRLTRLSTSTYGLSVKRHTGRWERTPFSGSMEEMVETILGCMQHLVAPY